MPRIAKARVPGEVSEPEVEEVAAVQDETVAVPKSQLDAMMAQMAALTAKVQSMESRPASRRPDPVAELPSAEGVDVTKLKTPILTKQGWLVPETYGANPNAPKAF